MMQNSRRKRCAAALVLVTVGLALICEATSARWVGTRFPGFLVMANRVVASVSLPYWPAAHNEHLYQHVVVAVNSQSVTTSGELYALIRRLPPGTPLTYTLEKDGQISQVTLASLTFTFKDYYLLFGAYLLNGLALALIGISAWFFKPSASASRALLILGLTGGLFALTGVDLYAPHWFFRLHVLGEALLPAGLLHLALVFPVDRLRRSRPFLLSVPHLVASAVGAAYEALLYHPAAYSFIHNLCMVCTGIGGLALLGKIVWDYYTASSPLIRWRIRLILLGFLSGFAFPAALMLFSGISGGEVAVNYAAFTGFLFPLSLSYAIVKHDAFEQARL
jgi:hypothetical protein